MTNKLVNRQTVLAVVAAVCFVLLAVAATSTLTVVLAAAGVVTLALVVWRWVTFGRDADYH